MHVAEVAARLYEEGMHLPWWIRVRAVTEGRAARAILATSPLRDRLARKRGSPIDGCTLDPQLAALLRLDDLIGSSDLRALAPAAARRRVAAEILAVEAAPPTGVMTRDFEIPGPAGDRPARLYVPRSLLVQTSSHSPPSPAVLYLHGGGFVTCDLDTHDVFCRRIALGAKARVIALDYRLAPEHRYPAAVDDAVAAFRFIADNAAKLDIDPKRIAVAGDSAGGNLSAVVARRTKSDAIRPVLQVPIYPAVDTRREQASHTLFGDGFLLTKPMLDWYYDHYVPDIGRRLEPDCCPLLASSEDLAGVAPALVYSAGFDPLRDEASDYVVRLKEEGVSAKLVCFETMMHGFALITGVCTAAREASERIAREIGEALRG